MLAAPLLAPPPSSATAPAVGRRPAVVVPAAAAATADMVAVARKRVLFGHQSVGWNIMSGVADLYRIRHVRPVPSQPQWSGSLSARGGWFAQAGIGQNGSPVSKVKAFNALVRSGAGRRANVVVMKLCFVDITAGTNVASLFRYYRSVMASLHAAYPSLVIVHVTAPLTTGDVADNVVRQKYNALLRAQYGSTGRLFDLALVESTTPTGARVGGTYRGYRYFALWSGYSSDGGHLNTRGSQRAADYFLRVLSRARA
jgi:hypothetical protein